MSRASVIYNVGNAAGLFLYVLFVVSIQRRMQMEERSPDLGDNMNFMFTALPVLVIAVLWNGVWAIAALERILGPRRYDLAVSWVAFVLVWVATVHFLPKLG